MSEPISADAREPGPAPPRRAGAGLLAALAAVGVIALLVAGVLGYRALAAQRAALDRVSQATQLIEDADAVVVEIDTVVRTPVKEGLEASAEAAEARVESARTGLEDALRLVDLAYPRLTGQNRERAALLKEAAQARLEMLSQAPVILSTSAKAARALPPGSAAWGRVLKADDLSDKAVARYNKLTSSGVRSSRRLNREAAEELKAARELFARAEEAFPEARFEVYLAFVDARIAANRTSQRSDTAWLAGDLVKANELIKTYNEQDKRVVAQAKGLPASPSKAIADAYAAIADAPTQAYYAARTRATRADARLRGL